MTDKEKQEIILRVRQIGLTETVEIKGRKQIVMKNISEYRREVMDILYSLKIDEVRE